jgi:hypothetical protein
MDTNASSAAPAAPATDPGRDGRGRFVKGNAGGTGNPFARRTAALRRALCEAVNEEDIRQMVEVIKLKALGGDLAACKLLLSYCVGRPAPSVEPDTLDEQEFRQYEREVGLFQKVPDIIGAITPGACCTMVRIARPTVSDAQCGQLADIIRAGHMPGEGPEDDDAEPQERSDESCPERTPPPSGNGRRWAGQDGRTAGTPARLLSPARH